MTDQIEEKQESKTREKWTISSYYGGKKVTVLKCDPGYEEAKKVCRPGLFGSNGL